LHILLNKIQEEIEKFEELLDKMDLVKETYFATFNNIPIVGDKKELIDIIMLLLNANISKCNQKLKEINFDSPFQSQCSDKEIAEYII
jgi:hypothetical protein